MRGVIWSVSNKWQSSYFQNSLARRSADQFAEGRKIGKAISSATSDQMSQETEDVRQYELRKIFVYRRLVRGGRSVYRSRRRVSVLGSSRGHSGRCAARDQGGREICSFRPKGQ